MTDKEEMELTQVLVENVYCNHRRAHFGRPPPDQCRLCAYGNGEYTWLALLPLFN